MGNIKWCRKIIYFIWKIFCVQTAGKNLHKIKHHKKNLRSYCYVQEFYQNILSSAQLKVNETIAEDMLYSIVRLYIQVRVVSFTRGIVHKDRIKNRKIIATEPLRKEIKSQVKCNFSRVGLWLFFAEFMSIHCKSNYIILFAIFFSTNVKQENG